MTPATDAPARRRLKFHWLTVENIRPLTNESVEISFAIPPDLSEEFSYVPGQHVAVRTTIDGVDVRRSYSLCAVPDGESIKIGVKETPGGIFSTFVQDQLKPGDVLEVMNPQGTFTSHLPAETRARTVAIAAGSGITPVMALASSVLENNPHAAFTLIYANRSVADVMFLEELADLKDRFPGRLDIHHVLSREGRSSALYSGRIDEEKLDQLFAYIVPPGRIDEWFLCGPLELVDLCRDKLDAAGVDRARIHFELFTTGDGPSRAAPRKLTKEEIKGPQRKITFQLDGRSSTVETPAEAPETVLAAALRQRSDVPFACAGGVCGTCRAVLVSGDVSMADNFALEPDELEAGYVLTCQSTPTTDQIEVDYDR